MEYTRGSGAAKQYFIPPEIVITDVYGKYYSVLVGKGGWVSGLKLSYYLNPQGWSVQEYYNVYFLHIGRNDNPVCKCGTPLRWVGKISHGGYYDYCSLKCSQRALGESEEFKRSRSEYMTNRWLDPEYVEFMNNKSNIVTRYAAWSRGALYKQLDGRDIEAWFYVSYTDNIVKIGSALKDYHTRLIYPNNRVFIGSASDVIECEYDFKINHINELANIEHGHSGWTESFSTLILPMIDDHTKKFNLRELII